MGVDDCGLLQESRSIQGRYIGPIGDELAIISFYCIRDIYPATFSRWLISLSYVEGVQSIHFGTLCGHEVILRISVLGFLISSP
jgi:hypothetical protein